MRHFIDILKEENISKKIWKQGNSNNSAVVTIEKSYVISVDLELVKQEFGSISKDNIEQFADNILVSNPELKATQNSYHITMPAKIPDTKIIKKKPKRFKY